MRRMDQALEILGTETTIMDRLLDYAMGTCTTGYYQTVLLSLITRKKAAKPFPLLKLPPELRAMIFEPLIQAGDLSILRVSKLINQESVSLLSKVAIFRINNLKRGTNGRMTVAVAAKITLSGELTLWAPDHIQNIDVCLDMVRRPTFPVNTKLLQYFSGNQVPRRSCKITILFGILGAVPKPVGANKTYQVISSLTGFSSLTLKLEYYEDKEYEATMLRRMNPLLITDEPYLTYEALLRDYEDISEYLAFFFGHAKLSDRRGEPYLSFKPRAFRDWSSHPQRPLIEVSMRHPLDPTEG